MNRRRSLEVWLWRWVGVRLLRHLMHSRSSPPRSGASASSHFQLDRPYSIPIIFAAVSDPIGLGLIKSLARPGGNIIGRTNITGELGAKRFEMLLKMAPWVLRMAVLQADKVVE